MSIFSFFKELVFGKPLKTQFEEMLLEDERRSELTSLKQPEPVVEEAIVPEPEPVVEEAIVPEPEPVVDPVPEVQAVPRRAKDAKGRFVADDISTPEINEAWEGGKAPTKRSTLKTGKRAKARKRKK